MERKKLNKPKAQIEPQKLIIKPEKKEKKNNKIAKILKLLDIEDSDEDKDEIIIEKKKTK